MTFEEFQDLIARLRTTGRETQTCDVRESADKLPASIVETLSAFANSVSGGTVVLGLSEKNGFRPIETFNAVRMQEALVSAGERLTPVVRPKTEIFPLDGTKVLVAHVPPMSSEMKPCYVTQRGMYMGSYIRSGDGDRRLTPYEVDRLIEVKRQPCWDAEPVAAGEFRLPFRDGCVERVAETCAEPGDQIAGEKSVRFELVSAV